MKSIYKGIRFLSIIMAISLVLPACEKGLEPQIFDQISPTNFFKTEEDVNAAVTGIYSELLNFDSRIFSGETATDEYLANWGGSGAANSFNWGEVTNDDYYNSNVAAVTKAGNLIEIIRGDLPSSIDEGVKKRLLAESRTIRAICMFDLLRLYGPCPVIINKQNLLFPDNSYKPPRPDLETPEGIQFRADQVLFIETELTEAAADLPVNASEYGRMDKGTALTELLKLYLHEKDWTNVEIVSKQIMDLNKYQLQADYNSIWLITNEKNKEIIWAIPRTSNTFGQDFRTRTLHTDYNITDETKWNGDKIRFEFLDQFDPADKRKTNIIDKFVNKTNVSIDMRDEKYSFYGAFSLKYGRDPNAITYSGVDVIMLRYADVLLSRAEALNELNGPSQEAIDLINQIRTRAKVAPINLADFDKGTLRDHILKERGWEFWMEGQRRDDLIRHGKYIQYALDRGDILAKPYMVLNQIPKNAIIENENIKQNPGYNF